MNKPASREQRVAFFGGSFDPPHMGHLAVAHAALEALSLDAVLFAPVGSQPLKPSGATASFQDRAAMTRLAIAKEPAFKLSLADAPKPGDEPNYTLETLISVKDNLPKHSALYCLMGADSFAGLRRWFRAAEIPFVAPLIVASRPREPLHDLEALLPPGLSLVTGCKSGPAQSGKANANIKVQCYSLVNQEGLQVPFYLLPDVDIPVSASQIREWIGRPVDAHDSAAERELLPDAVAEYIRTKGLYR
jgi:nicotinate-nucleotide adenylyltransferase